MTEVTHAQISPMLAQREPGSSAAVWLVYGEEMLVEETIQRISAHLLGGAPRDLGYESLDGLAENIPDLLETINTFALLGTRKVVVFKDARIFDTGKIQQRLHTQIKQAWQNDQIAKAARYFLSLCGQCEISIEDFDPHDPRPTELKNLVDDLGTEGVTRLKAYCLEQGWSAGSAEDQVKSLAKAIEKGFPQEHFLLIGVNGKVAKTLKLYKRIAASGTVVDCSVALSERRADKIAQEAVLKQTLESLLVPSGKRMAPHLFSTLCQLTGFDPRTFSRNVEKLIDYAGPRPEITAEDIEAVIQRTKSDPIYELTGALAERNAAQTLFYLNSLLSADFHPLQLLAAMANQTRKLLVAKDFTLSEFGRAWSRGMNYTQFQGQVMPAVLTYDDHLQRQAQQWHQGGSADNMDKADKAIADLRLAANPKSAYPIYQLIAKSENFSRDELIEALMQISQADVELKSTGQDPVLIVKRTVMSICRKR